MITKDEWLAELERLQVERAQPDGMTSQEMADALKITKSAMMKKLNLAHRLGRLESARSVTTGIDGRTIYVPVYKLKPAP